MRNPSGFWAAFVAIAAGGFLILLGYIINSGEKFRAAFRVAHRERFLLLLVLRQNPWDAHPDLPGDAVERLFALGLALEQLRHDFRELKQCVSEYVRSIMGTAPKRAN
jgi:hypothetical protein